MKGVFQRQQHIHSQVRWLSLLFCASLAFIVMLAHIISGLISFLANKGGTNWFLSKHSFFLTGCVVGIVFLGSLFRWWQLRKGGVVFAKLFLATRINNTSTSRTNRQISDVVDEMSIASRQKAPEIWVMEREPGINAFVAGSRERGLVLVISQGSLNSLSRSELQSMVAHEFAHLRNGDLRLGMQLLIVMSGLLAIDQVGRILVGPGFRQRLWPFVIVGFVLRFLGSAGVLSAGLIRAALWRQREYLADAGSVQFSRDPHGLASVFAKVAEHAKGSRLNAHYAEEVAHLCFLNPVSQTRLIRTLPLAPILKRYILRQFRVHPDLHKRIHRIDPLFYHRKEKRLRNRISNQTQRSVSDTLGLGVVSQEGVAESPSANRSNLLPDRLSTQLMDNLSCEAMLYALLICAFEGNAAIFYKALELKVGKAQSRKTEEIVRRHVDLLGKYEIELIESAADNLRNRQSISDRKRMFDFLESTTRLDGGHNLQEYLLLNLIEKSLDVSSLECQQNNYPEQKIHISYAVVLSLFVEAAGSDSKILLKTYSRALRIYTKEFVPPHSVLDENCVDALKHAIHTIGLQLPIIRKAFVQHCAELILVDAHITYREKSLLHLLAITLYVPMPELLPKSVGL